MQHGRIAQSRALSSHLFGLIRLFEPNPLHLPRSPSAISGGEIKYLGCILLRKMRCDTLHALVLARWPEIPKEAVHGPASAYLQPHPLWSWCSPPSPRLSPPKFLGDLPEVIQVTAAAAASSIHSDDSLFTGEDRSVTVQIRTRMINGTRPLAGVHESFPGHGGRIPGAAGYLPSSDQPWPARRVTRLELEETEGPIRAEPSRARGLVVLW